MTDGPGLPLLVYVLVFLFAWGVNASGLADLAAKATLYDSGCDKRGMLCR
jgi:hypothetical protein